jgi:hypothetical protein
MSTEELLYPVDVTGPLKNLDELDDLKKEETLASKTNKKKKDEGFRQMRTRISIPLTKIRKKKPSEIFMIVRDKSEFNTSMNCNIVFRLSNLLKVWRKST